MRRKFDSARKRDRLALTGLADDLAAGGVPKSRAKAYLEPLRRLLSDDYAPERGRPSTIERDVAIAQLALLIARDEPRHVNKATARRLAELGAGDFHSETIRQIRAKYTRGLLTHPDGPYGPSGWLKPLEGLSIDFPWMRSWLELALQRSRTAAEEQILKHARAAGTPKKKAPTKNR